MKKASVIFFGSIVLITCLFALLSHKYWLLKMNFENIYFYIPKNYHLYLTEAVTINGKTMPKTAIVDTNANALPNNSSQNILFIISACDEINIEKNENARDFLKNESKSENTNETTKEMPITGLGVPKTIDSGLTMPSINKKNIVELDNEHIPRCVDYRLLPNRNDQRSFMFIENKILYELIYYPLKDHPIYSEVILNLIKIKKF